MLDNAGTIGLIGVRGSYSQSVTDAIATAFVIGIMALLVLNLTSDATWRGVLRADRAAIAAAFPERIAAAAE